MPELSDALGGLYNLVEKIGKDFSVVQGLGGNVSFKSNGILFVKASGKRFGKVRESDYFYKCSLRGQEFEDDIPGQSGKPSIEAFLHSLLPHKFIIHLHSNNSVAASMVVTAKKLASDELTNTRVRLVPYARPGLPLHDKIKSQVLDDKTEVLLLQNHGAIYFGDNLDSLEDSILRWEQVWRDMREVKSYRSFSPDHIGLELTSEECAHVLWQAENNWRISPDHVVFLGATPEEFIKKFTSSRVILEKTGSYTAPSRNFSVRDEQLIWYLNVALSLPKRILPTLSLEEALWLGNWDSERHRVEMSQRHYGKT